jgi:hypothetical protein
MSSRVANAPDSARARWVTLTPQGCFDLTDVSGSSVNRLGYKPKCERRFQELIRIAPRSFE